MKTTSMAVLATMWRFIFWIWNILILGAAAGVLGNILYTIFTTGSINLKDPRTLAIATWLNTHLLPCILIFTIALMLTLCSFLAHRQQQQALQTHQRQERESLVTIAGEIHTIGKGIQQALNERSLTNSPQSSSSIEAGKTVKQKAPPETIWNVPYRRNPFFTGREHLLKQLHDNLTTNKATAVTQAQAVNGLGGIGKTEVAVEYSYRYRDEYAAVFWLNAAGRETLFADYTSVAKLLHLPIPDERDQEAIVRNVKNQVATHADYLLIFDNADDLSLLEDFLPLDYTCHILITTCEYATSRLAQSLEVASLDIEEGREMLLKRAKVLVSDHSMEQVPQQERETATHIVQAMDGLPLALDQAGAYIEETQCSLAAYLEQYRRKEVTLLQRRGTTGKAHPEPVATTWFLSFAQVEHQSPLAADLLRFCAFLAPDDIPEPLIQDGASHLGSPLQSIGTDPALLDEAIGLLLHFSLVKRKRDTQTIAVHRLVQTVQRTSMDPQTQQTWAERTIRAVNQAFPDVTDYRNWLRCQHSLPHALACSDLIATYHLVFPEASGLLNRTGYYLHDQAQYPQVLPLYQRALAIREKVVGAEHPDTASSLNNLAALYKTQGDYAQALPLYQRALAIFERALGKNHPSTKIVRANYEQLQEEE